MPQQKGNAAFPGSDLFLVLALLENGDRTGYQLIRELECRSDKSFAMQEGILYAVLHTLEEQNEVRSYEKKTAADHRRHRFYKLTRQGVRTLDRCRHCKKRGKSYGKAVGGEACDPK